MEAVAARPRKAELTLTRILDAALDCYVRQGIGATTLEDVARAAGVGRSTLYRYVDNRDDLLLKVVQRDAVQQQEEMRLLTRYQNDFGQSLVDSIIYVMRGRRSRPINALLFGSNENDLIDRVNLSPGDFHPMAEELMAPLFEKAFAQGQIREGVTLEQAAKWTTRILLSLINYPEEFLEDEVALRDFLQKFLVPSLVRDAEAGTPTSPVTAV